MFRPFGRSNLESQLKKDPSVKGAQGGILSFFDDITEQEKALLKRQGFKYYFHTNISEKVVSLAKEGVISLFYVPELIGNIGVYNPEQKAFCGEIFNQASGKFEDSRPLRKEQFSTSPDLPAFLVQYEENERRIMEKAILVPHGKEETVLGMVKSKSSPSDITDYIREK